MRWTSVARGGLTALVFLFAASIVYLPVLSGGKIAVPTEALTAIMPLLMALALWSLNQLKQGQKENRDKIEEATKSVENGVGKLLELTEVKAFVRGGEATAREIYESLPLPYVELTQSNFTIVRVNEYLLELTGYARDELIGQNLQVLVPEKSRKAHQEDMLRYTDDPGVRPMGVGMLVELRRKDGSEVPVEVRLGTFHSIAGPVVIALVAPVARQARG